MKKKLLFLLTPLLLLTSCNSYYNVDDEKAKYLEYCQNIIPHTYTKYSVEGKGHVVSYDCNPSVSVKTDQALTSTTKALFYNRSVPLQIDATSEDKIEEVFQTFTTFMTSTIDPDPRFYVEITSDNLLHFYTLGLHKKDLQISNVDARTPIKVTCRFVFDYYYNNQGLLVKESIKSLNTVTNDKNKTVEVIADYTYA